MNLLNYLSKLVITIGFPIEKNKRIAYLDYDKLDFPLTLRTWKRRRLVYSLRNEGHAKLGDYFSDHKLLQLRRSAHGFFVVATLSFGW